MKNMMNPLRIDSPEADAVLLANRVMLVVVGLVWIGLIGYRLAVGEYWRLLVSMVPMIALIWHGTYLLFKRHGTVAPTAVPRGSCELPEKVDGRLRNQTTKPSGKREACERPEETDRRVRNQTTKPSSEGGTCERSETTEQPVGNQTNSPSSERGELSLWLPSPF